MVVVFHAAVGYSRDRPQSQHFFFDLEIGAKKIIFGVDYFAPPRIICANRRCWNVSGLTYGMLVKEIHE